MRLAAALVLALGGTATLPAHAQQQQIGIGDEATPPRHQALSGGNVDPKTGEFLLETLDLSVGSGDFPSRLDLVRVQSSLRDPEFKLEGRAVCPGCAYDGSTNPLNLHPSKWGSVNVILFGTTYSFAQNGSGGYDNLKRDGAVLRRDAADKRLEFTGRDGLKAYFEFQPDFTCGYATPAGNNVVKWSVSICQRVRYLEMADGQSLSYKYTTRTAPNFDAMPLAYPAEVVNSRGYGIRFSYEDSDNQTLITKASAFRTSCVSSATVECTTGTLATATYAYEHYYTLNCLQVGKCRNRQVRFVDPEGAETLYEYDPLLRLMAAKLPANPTTRAFTNAYATDGKVDYQLDAQLNKTEYTFGATETLVADPLNHVTRYGFSGTKVLPDYIEDANGSRTTYTYDAYLRATRIQSHEGDAVEFGLDDRGNVTTFRRTAKPGSGLADLVSTATFPACSDANYRICNKPTDATDERNARTDYAYDPAHGGLTVQIAPPNAQGLRAVTRIGYATAAPATGTAPPAAAGADPIVQSSVTLRATVDQCLSSQPGVTTSFVCPGADTVRTSYSHVASTSGAPTSFELQGITADPSGANLTTAYVYDRVGNVIREDGPRAGADVTSYAYDRRRLPTLATAPTAGGATPRTRYTYDEDGKLEKIENSLGAAWTADTTIYDTRGLAVQRTGPDGSVVGQSYDIAGRAYETTQTVDGGVRRIRNVLDPGGRTTAVRLAVGTPLEQAVSTVTYSPNGQVLTQTDASGHVSTFCYDGFDRLVERRYPAPATGLAPTCAAIAAGGALPSGVTRERFVYLNNGDLTSLVLRDGRTVAFGYDDLGRVTGKDVPDADRDVAYVYDLLGRRTQANLPGTNAALSVGWSYDKLGRVQTVTGPFGRTVSYSYDPALAWMEVQWPDAVRMRYTRDLLGRMTTVADQSAGVTLATYGYDELSRLTTLARGNGAPSAFGYDAQYRLSSVAHDLAGTAQDVAYGLTYNEAGEIRTRTTSNSAYAIPSPGNASRTYRAAVGGAAGGNGLNQYGAIDPNPNVLSYDLNGNLTQDADPQRTLNFGYDSESRLVSAGGTTLAYDAIGRLAQVTTGTTGRRFLYDGTDLIGEYDAASGALVRRTVHGPDEDEPLVVYENGNRAWLYADERGSIVAQADAGGASVQTNSYGEFGEPGSANAGRFGYTGQVWLPEAGLYHYKARAYSPWLGRFMQPDPIGEEGGMNLYAYVGNDPVNLVDPDGLQDVPGVRVVLGGSRQSPTADPNEIVITGFRMPTLAQITAQLQAAARSAQAQSWKLKPFDDYFLRDARESFQAARRGDFRGAALMGAGVALDYATRGVSKRIRKSVCGCLTAGTMVATPSGLAPIETIKVGDLVLAYDEKTGKSEPKPVTDLIRPEPKPTFLLTLTDAQGETETFEATDDHPWLVQATGGAVRWTKTHELKPRDRLRAADGETLALNKVAATGRIDRTYNLTVADLHTFLVGEDGVVVHNSCPVFRDLKDHARRHSDVGPEAYRRAAIANMTSGKKFRFYHNGVFKNGHITRTGMDSFMFTSSSQSGRQIFTHMEVSGQYLRNIGITLPKGF